jgi:enolase
VFIALDVAATEFYDAKKTYTIDGKRSTRPAWSTAGRSWVDKYPICSIEDGCSEDDWDGWKLLTDGSAKRAARGRRPVRDQHRSGCSAGSTRGSPTAS